MKIKLYYQIIVILCCFIISSWGFEKVDLVVSASETQTLQERNEYDNLRVESGGEIKVDRYCGKLEILSGLIQINYGGGIIANNVSGEYGQLLKPLPIIHGGNGAGYGGIGGAPTSEEQGEIYGSTEQPAIMRGSHGGCGPDEVRYGGRPGGSITLWGSDVIVDGTLECNGNKGEDWTSNPVYGPAPQRYYGGGGGSGGGILILAKNLTIGPNAHISANGGDGGDGISVNAGYEGYPGGGGRIKIFYETGTISESAVIEALPGSTPEGGSDGGVQPGTIHIQQVRSITQLLNPGDINGDGTTDSQDLFLLMQNWHEEVESSTP